MWPDSFLCPTAILRDIGERFGLAHGWLDELFCHVHLCVRNLPLTRTWPTTRVQLGGHLWCSQAKANTMGWYLQFSHWRASTTFAFRCSGLGILHFGQGHPGCNYRFTADVSLPGLEILKGGSRGCPHCGGGGGGSGKRGRDLWSIYYPINTG